VFQIPLDGKSVILSSMRKKLMAALASNTKEGRKCWRKRVFELNKLPVKASSRKPTSLTLWFLIVIILSRMTLIYTLKSNLRSSSSPIFLSASVFSGVRLYSSSFQHGHQEHSSQAGGYVLPFSVFTFSWNKYGGKTSNFLHPSRSNLLIFY